MADAPWENTDFGYPYIIAEVGVNHNGDFDLAKSLIDMAQGSGADAVKFQYFTPEELVTKKLTKAKYQEANTGKGTQYEMLQSLALNKSQFYDLKKHAKSLGLDFILTPYSVQNAYDIYGLVDVIKISSGDLTHTPLIECVAKRDKPVILSTGMSTMTDVERALALFDDTHYPPLCLLHCVSTYPCKPEYVGLAYMDRLRVYNWPAVGYSDHTSGIGASIASAALGATVIEKHFTYDRDAAGPDHKSAIEPDMFKTMVTACREAYLSKGTRVSTFEDPYSSRRSIKAARKLFEGDVLSITDIKFVRPESGLPPYEYTKLLGLTLKYPVNEDEDILWEHFKY